MKLEFLNPEIRLPQERKSKLLNPDSELYKYIKKYKLYLQENGFPHENRMDLHVEVLNNNFESEAEFLNRVTKLEGRDINVAESLKYANKYIYIDLGNLQGYHGVPHITVAYFGQVDSNYTKKAFDLFSVFNRS